MFPKVPWVLSVFLNDLKKLGYPKMVMPYDPEPAFNSVVEAAKNGFDKELVLEKVPRGVSSQKGKLKEQSKPLSPNPGHSGVHWRQAMEERCLTTTTQF